MVSLASLRPAAQSPSRQSAQSAADRLSPDRLRAAQEVLSRGLTVVTTIDPHGGPLGTAAESAGAVWLTPALVLARIDEGSATLGPALTTRRFALNVLTTSMTDVALRFTGAQRPDVWEQVPHDLGDGLPVLR